MDDLNSTQTDEIKKESTQEAKENAAKTSFNVKKLLPVIILAAVIVIAAIVLIIIFVGGGNNGGNGSGGHVHAHGTPIIDNEVAATCLSAGSYDEIIKCTLCNETISTTHKIIPKSEHTDGGEGVCTVCENAFKPNPKITYKIYESEGYAEVKSYSGAATVVMIADTYEGYPVTSIGFQAFAFNQNLTEVIIPESITHIKDDAFARCKKLKSPVLPKNLVSLGNSAFKECHSITSLRIPGSLKLIDDYAFYDCRNLKYVIFGEGVETLNQDSFDSCTKLTYIVLPKSIKNINARAFLLCDNQKRIYYLGTPDDYYDIDIAFWNDCIHDSTWYYYSENQPDAHPILKFWHYNDKGNIVIWE